MKKFDYKIVLSIIGVVVGLIFLIFANMVQWFLCLGLILLGFSLAMFAFYYSDKINKLINQVKDEMATDNFEKGLEADYISFIKNQKKKKKRIEISFYLCATLLIVIAFASLI